jgi:putative ABC transport system permease protein
MFINWDYINEQLLKTSPERANKVGWYVVRIANAADAASISEKVDALFKNSDGETKTETEKAFQAGFIAMSGAIITGLQVISYVIIGIIFLVLANTMLMSARERIREYAVLKTLGFTARHVAGLVFGESIAIAILGGLLGIALTFPIVTGFAVGMARFFPSIAIAPLTIVLAAIFALLVGIIAGIIPATRSAKINIVDGLRRIG